MGPSTQAVRERARVTVSALPSSPGSGGWDSTVSYFYEQSLYYNYFFCVKVLLILSLVCTERFF